MYHLPTCTGLNPAAAAAASAAAIVITFLSHFQERPFATFVLKT
jgi:hypothetical protein